MQDGLVLLNLLRESKSCPSPTWVVAPYRGRRPLDGALATQTRPSELTPQRLMSKIGDIHGSQSQRHRTTSQALSARGPCACSPSGGSLAPQREKSWPPHRGRRQGPDGSKRPSGGGHTTRPEKGPITSMVHPSGDEKAPSARWGNRADGDQVFLGKAEIFRAIRPCNTPCACHGYLRRRPAGKMFKIGRCNRGSRSRLFA